MGSLGLIAATRSAAEAARMQEFARRDLDRHISAKANHARELLNVSPSASLEEIRAAFASKVKESHPDTGGSGGDIQQLKQARNLLLEYHKSAQRLPFDKDVAMQTCPMCSGRGSVAVGFNNQRCTTCDGKGEVSC